MNNIVFTGRFQPLHIGHIEFIRTIKRKYPKELLIICIIRNSYEEILPKEKNNFYLVSKEKQQKINNPIPNWERFILLKTAIDNDNELKNNTIIIFRDRPDLDWTKSVQDLPENRMFIFPSYCQESFDFEKIQFYKNKNESIDIIDNFNENQYSASQIRTDLRKGNKKISFLPSCCRDYFIKNCLKYFK